jgi:hypothetical protein
MCTLSFPGVSILILCQGFRGSWDTAVLSQKAGGRVERNSFWENAPTDGRRIILTGEGLGGSSEIAEAGQFVGGGKHLEGNGYQRGYPLGL